MSPSPVCLGLPSHLLSGFYIFPRYKAWLNSTNITNILYKLLTSPMHTECPAYLILLDLITYVNFNIYYFVVKIFSSAHCFKQLQVCIHLTERQIFCTYMKQLSYDYYKMSCIHIFHRSVLNPVPNLIVFEKKILVVLRARKGCRLF
jgi:hypothetical protein